MSCAAEITGDGAPCKDVSGCAVHEAGDSIVFSGDCDCATGSAEFH